MKLTPNDRTQMRDGIRGSSVTVCKQRPDVTVFPRKNGPTSASRRASSADRGPIHPDMRTADDMSRRPRDTLPAPAATRFVYASVPVVTVTEDFSSSAARRSASILASRAFWIRSFAASLRHRIA